MRLLVVGQDYPAGNIPVVPNGGGVFEVETDGSLHLTILLPGITTAEMAAIEQGFSGYALFVSPDPPHAAVWVWKFPAPVGYMETPFHAGLYKDDRIQQEFLTKTPEENNALMVVTLNGRKITNLRLCGLQHAALAKFHETVWRQLVETPITMEKYAKALESIYSRFTGKDMYERGTSWRHREG